MSSEFSMFVILGPLDSLFCLKLRAMIFCWNNIFVALADFTDSLDESCVTSPLFVLCHCGRYLPLLSTVHHLFQLSETHMDSLTLLVHHTLPRLSLMSKVILCVWMRCEGLWQNVDIWQGCEQAAVLLNQCLQKTLVQKSSRPFHFSVLSLWIRVQLRLEVNLLLQTHPGMTRELQ